MKTGRNGFLLHSLLQISDNPFAVVHRLLQSFTTSYSPSRFLADKRKNRPDRRFFLCWHLPIFPDRHQSSIFGTNELNFRVRHGNGWTLIVINTNYSIHVAFDDFVIITLLFFTVKYSPHKRFLQFVYSV